MTTSRQPNLKFDFSGKVVLITGGSQGIGYAAASAFRDAGAVVHVTGTRASEEEYGQDFTGMTYHRVVVDDPASRVAISDKFESLDILVNNAGIARDDEYGFEGFQKTLAVNLEGTAALCYLFKERLSAAKGAIINTASVASYIVLSDRPAYTASKHALLGFTRALGDRWAKRGIRVNCVAPGFVDTRLTDWAKADKATTDRMMGRVPLGRFGSPMEVALPILFLASDAASYVTGHGLVIDGGFTLR